MGEQIFDFFIECSGVIHRRLLLASVEIVLSLLKHREWARHCDFYFSLRVGF